MQGRAPRALAVLLWLMLWQGAAAAVGQEFILASPLRVLRRLFDLLLQGNTYHAAAQSSFRVLLGFCLGTGLGALLGFLSHRSLWLRAFFAPLLAVCRSVPVASFVILALILVSSRWLTPLITMIIALPVVYSAVLEGLGQMDARLLEMAQVFRVPPRRRLMRLVLPQLAPYLRAGLVTALGLSWKSGAAAELIGVPAGSLGERLYAAKVHLDTADLFAWTLIIVALNLLTASLLSGLLRGALARLEGA